ncbi:MAG: PIN domain-containing protein [Chloroflexota bacterium]|nr:PIN domain-containing protein [Chloroflexota bacterium]
MGYQTRPFGTGPTSIGFQRSAHIRFRGDGGFPQRRSADSKSSAVKLLLSRVTENYPMPKPLPWLPRGAPAKRVSLRWLGVVDSSVLVAAVVSSHPQSPNREVVELALVDVFVMGVSDYIRSEVEGTLLEDFGLTQEQIDAVLSPIWRVARWLEPVPETPELRAAIKDPNDRPILQAAIGAYSIPELAPLPEKYLISENTTHFKPGRNHYGFECITSGGFLADIRRATR